MKRTIAAAAAALTVIVSLTGCDMRSQCEIDGGVEEFSHYTFMMTMMPNGSGGFTYMQQPVPHYTCNMEGVQ